MSARQHVACGGCHACCYGQAIALTDEDMAKRADWVLDAAPVLPMPMLAQRADGACVYLIPGLGCSVHDDPPEVCKTFHCGHWFRSLGERERALMRVFGTARQLDMLEAGRRHEP